jgi:hypothetical protein
MKNSAGLRKGAINGFADLEDTWSVLFPQGTRVAALPNWQRPRVLIPADTLRRRWYGSGYYPAFRPGARLYRLLLRAMAASGIGSVRFARSPHLGLNDFVQELLPEATVGAVMIGMPGSSRKLVARLTDARGQVVGYLKCATRPRARRALRNEYRLLGTLPPGVGPAALGYRQLDSIDGLLLAPVFGRTLRATLPPPHDLSGFTAALTTSSAMGLERHPWVRSVSHWRGPAVEWALSTLSGRAWPTVIHHGDLAPWNMLRTDGGRLTAVDWECGCSAGFPGLDLAQYLLQVACLCLRWSPRDSRDYAIRYLAGDSPHCLSPAEARALVTLSAYSTFRLAAEDGHAFDDPFQRWQRAIWEVTK